MYTRNTSFYLSGWIPSGVDGGEIFDYLLRTVDDDNNIGLFNAGFYSNPDIDRIGEEVSYIMDYQNRLALMQEAFEIAMEDVAWIPLFSIHWLYGVSDDIEFTPRPDLNILLDMPVDGAVARRRENESEEDIHEEDDCYMEQVKRIYRRLTLWSQDTWRTVDTYADDKPLSKEAIASEVYQHVMEVAAPAHS